jgi:cytidylate kinase
MTVISISSGLSRQGKEISQRLADRLSYQLVSREVLLDASKQFNIPEIKLKRAIDNAPSILDRFFYGKEKYVAYIKEAIFSRLEQGNSVYHGLAGHFFLQGIPRVLKIQVVSNLEDRIQDEILQHGVSRSKAKRLIEKDDEERRRWGLHLYGMDTRDPRLYDLVVNLSTISVGEAEEIILHTLKQPCFQADEASKTILAEKALEAKVFAALVEKHPTVQVNIVESKAYVSVRAGSFEAGSIKSEVENLLGDFSDRIEIEVNINPIMDVG